MGYDFTYVDLLRSYSMKIKIKIKITCLYRFKKHTNLAYYIFFLTWTVLWVELFGSISFKEGIPIILKIRFGLCGSAQDKIFTLLLHSHFGGTYGWEEK